VLAQRCQRRVMAGVKHQHVGTVVKGHGQCALDVAAPRFNLRRQARLSLSLGPK
jgi:1,2-phenylacetyl-CoA epoxidase PaaB subunit